MGEEVVVGFEGSTLDAPAFDEVRDSAVRYLEGVEGAREAVA
jgi:hypothetical protein